MNTASPYIWSLLEPLELIEHQGRREGLFTSAHIESQTIHVDFSLSQEKWFPSKLDGQKYYHNWSLWETDVVEFFLQGRNSHDDVSAPYIEFLLSPNNKTFALKTFKPRECTATPLDLDFIGISDVSEGKWKASMQILNPFEDSKFLYGNFHCCLGEKSCRKYFSAYNMPKETPDFHRPEQFQLLGTKI